MDNIYYLNEYTYSKKMVKELPIIINKLEQFNNQLNQHSNYWVIARLQMMLNDVSLDLQYNYRYYREIYDRKGKNE